MKSSILFASVFLGVVMLVLVFGGTQLTSVATRSCTLTALDVGQGDALLIQTPDQQDMLIDGGPGSGVVNALDRNVPLGDNDLEMVVATHPDSDHIGGLPSVLERYRVSTIMTTGVTSGSATDQRWQKAKQAEGAMLVTARAGQQYQLGRALVIEVLWPTDQWLLAHPQAPTNDTSVVLRITCAGSTALLTGDIPSTIEDILMDGGQTITASVLKVGHHGSRSSTSSRWLGVVKPRVVVISAGKHNRYGHPHPTVIERLKANDVLIRRTDAEGDVKLKSDSQGNWR